MSQREAVLGQSGLGRGRADAGLERRSPRVGVQLEQVVQPPKVKRDERDTVTTKSVQAADDARAATPRNDGDALGAADLERALHRVRVSRQEDGVRRGRRVA